MVYLGTFMKFPITTAFANKSVWRSSIPSFLSLAILIVIFHFLNRMWLLLSLWLKHWYLRIHAFGIYVLTTNNFNASQIPSNYNYYYKYGLGTTSDWSVTMPLLLSVAQSWSSQHTFSCSLDTVIDIVALTSWACLLLALVGSKLLRPSTWL